MTYYITSAIPYVNAKPHVGHALEFVQTDVIAKYHRLLGDDVTYLCGSDEHALKNVQAAEKAGMGVEEFCAENAQKFQELAQHLSVQFDIFQRASNKDHHLSSQELWKRCDAAGDIYKKSYEGLYCVGCETFYTRDELDEKGECFEHPGKPLETVKEENYFFRLSKYHKQVLEVIESGKLRIVPETRRNEVVSFLKGDVQDISISRTKERARNWGVEVPGDPAQVMYVWFDALNIYLSGIGFGLPGKDHSKLWPAHVQVIGKGITRFHAVYWIAMLLSAKLELPKNLFVHGYFTVDGQKMSKSLGNVVDPEEVVAEVGADAVRYYFLREISPIEDGDFSRERLRERYSAHLAHELGNLVSRLAKLGSDLGLDCPALPQAFSAGLGKQIDDFALKDAIDSIWVKVTDLNKEITVIKPWALEKAKAGDFVAKSLVTVLQVAYDLQPFLPNSSKTILDHFAGGTVKPITPLFPKLS